MEEEFVVSREQEKRDPRILRAEKLFLGMCIFITFFLILMSALWTRSPLINTFLGFLPLLATIVLVIILFDAQYKDFVIWAMPFVTCFLFLSVGSLLNPLLAYQLDIGALTVINLVLGLVVVLVAMFLQGKSIFPNEEEPEPENIEEFLHSIEDKCKALNFVIGRVYRASNGGTDALRTRLRIEKEWYNAFQEIQDLHKEKKHALTILHKMQDRLLLLAKPENEVFTSAEVSALKGLARDRTGKDVIADVLVLNDRDPVEHYYIGAVNGVKKLIDMVKSL